MNILFTFQLPHFPPRRTRLQNCFELPAVAFEAYLCLPLGRLRRNKKFWSRGPPGALESND